MMILCFHKWHQFLGYMYHNSDVELWKMKNMDKGRSKYDTLMFVISSTAQHLTMPAWQACIQLRKLFTLRSMKLWMLDNQMESLYEGVVNFFTGTNWTKKFTSTGWWKITSMNSRTVKSGIIFSQQSWSCFRNKYIKSLVYSLSWCFERLHGLQIRSLRDEKCLDKQVIASTKLRDNCTPNCWGMCSDAQVQVICCCRRTELLKHLIQEPF
jgi:hypothetical protein